MGNAAEQLRMSGAEFLVWEAAQREKHEFVAGEVFLMAGAEDRHVTVSLNLAMALRQHLRGTPCRTFMLDMKLAVEAQDSYFYPDVLVTCSAADAGRPLVKSDAKFVAEVLSPSTAAYDRGAKFAAYRRLPTLEEVLFIDIDRRQCDLFRKGDAGLWVLHPFAAGESVQLASVALDLPAEQLFAEIDDQPR